MRGDGGGGKAALMLVGVGVPEMMFFMHKIYEGVRIVYQADLNMICPKQTVHESKAMQRPNT